MSFNVTSPPCLGFHLCVWETSYERGELALTPCTSAILKLNGINKIVYNVWETTCVDPAAGQKCIPLTTTARYFCPYTFIQKHYSTSTMFMSLVNVVFHLTTVYDTTEFIHIASITKRSYVYCTVCNKYSTLFSLVCVCDTITALTTNQT